MRRRYLRCKEWVLLKMICALAAVLRFLKRQLPGGEVHAYRHTTGRRRSAVRSKRRLPRTGTERPNGQGSSPLGLARSSHIEQ